MGSQCRELMDRKWQECSMPSGVSGMGGRGQENGEHVDLLVISSNRRINLKLKGYFCGFNTQNTSAYRMKYVF